MKRRSRSAAGLARRIRENQRGWLDAPPETAGGRELAHAFQAAVHALAYPLGGEFHVAHGISNAVLLPHVMEFNLPACPERYSGVAVALGVPAQADAIQTARQGVERVREMARTCGIPLSLLEVNVPRSAIPHMTAAAMQVTRLLKNNPRELTVADAAWLYEQAFERQYTPVSNVNRRRPSR